MIHIHTTPHWKWQEIQVRLLLKHSLGYKKYPLNQTVFENSQIKCTPAFCASIKICQIMSLFCVAYDDIKVLFYSLVYRETV